MTPVEFNFALEHELAERGTSEYIMRFDANGDGQHFVARVGFDDGRWRDFYIELPAPLDLTGDWESDLMGAISLATPARSDWVH